jgi:sulfite exporter TauE/SafE
MSESGLVALMGSLFFAGIAGSLHCIGMCGPILASFFEVFRSDDERSRSKGSFALDFLAYHAGRIWTYGLLGFIVGLAGQRLREGGALFGWQRPVSIGIACAVILSGLLLLGLLPAGRLETLVSGCGVRRLQDWPWFRGLLHGRKLLSRFLLGAVMGLLPCGLVYAMLVMVATLPTPLHAAAGMLIFGLGTIPSLSAVLLASWSASGWLRRHGTRIVACTLIVTGGLMLARTLIVPADADAHAHHGHMTSSSPEE